MYDESMSDVLRIYFTFHSFFHIQHKNKKYGTSPLNTYKIPDIFLTLLKIHQYS